MLALFFCYYNFCRIHQTLRVTPAMAAGVRHSMAGKSQKSLINLNIPTE